MHQASGFKTAQNFLSLVIHRQLTENNSNSQKYVSLGFGSNHFSSSQITGLVTDMSLIYSESCCSEGSRKYSQTTFPFLVHSTNYHTNLKNIPLETSSYIFECIEVTLFLVY